MNETLRCYLIGVEVAGVFSGFAAIVSTGEERARALVAEHFEYFDVEVCFTVVKKIPIVEGAYILAKGGAG